MPPVMITIVEPIATIDRIETDYVWFIPLFVLVPAGLLAAAWRELYLAEKE